MSKPIPGTLLPGMSPDHRLDSSKKIAGYLHRDVKTVQRWEKREAGATVAPTQT
jgi:hypothetical protein